MDAKTAKISSGEEATLKLHSSSEGLTDVEARARLEQYGRNALKNENKRGALNLLIKQFKSSLIYMLLLADVLSFILKNANDAGVITAILLLNAGLGFFQEFKSEKAIEKLQKFVGKEILVRRAGKEVLVAEETIVPGDVVVLREGDIVPADMKLLRDDDLSVNESQLTGESVPVTKSIHGENSVVFAGSTVEQGEAEGVVFATAAKTELGKIAHLSSGTKRVTQYEQSLGSFSNFLVRVTFVTLAIVFVFKLIITHDFSHISSLALFIVALSIAVVPEAMPVIATVTLSSGALKLAKKHVIAKTLTAVEDLGNIDVLCSDKTGTLTYGKQTVKRLTSEDEELFKVLAIASLETLDEKRKKFQSTFDRAFLAYVPEAQQKLGREFKRLEEMPFDPNARRRRVVASNGRKTYLIEVGSTETLLDLTNPKEKQKYLELIKRDGVKGMRHLGIAYKEVKYTTSEDFDILEHEDHLKFVGFVALEDPLRPTAKHTIRLAESLGVAIKILSGDSREVTQYVAEEVGLVKGNDKVYVGDEIDKMSDEQLIETLQTAHAFARMNPEQKYRVIKLLKRSGRVVGYQGDGINDAPALKLADVAIAVNNATDVAQASADILLLRSDIGVIVNGIKYGRGIFANINKYIRYTMIGNFGNFFALSGLYLISASLPLLTIQLLLTNLLGDVPLVAIATDNVSVEELARPSKYNGRSLIFISLFLGSFTALFEIFFFAVVKNRPLGITQTSLYLYLTLIGFAIIPSVRGRGHFWKAPKLSRALTVAFGVIIAVSVAVVYVAPTKSLFSFSSLPLSLFGTIVAMTLVYLIVLDYFKVWFYQSKIGSTT
ncbi:MAG TPA: HAD-IC family P-type ATPase [Candidatus Saccharimonadales bacterium]